MSALAIPPSPRLRAVSTVSAASAPEASDARLEVVVGGRSTSRGARRAHLRLVTEDFRPALRPQAATEASSLPVELLRRPALRHEGLRPGAGAPARGAEAVVPGARRDVEELAPTHPSVRAVRARREHESHVRERQVPRRAAGAVSRAPEAVRVQAVGEQVASAPLPAALRHLVLAGAAVLATVLLLAGVIVASGLLEGPQRTTVATVQSGQSVWDLAAATGTSDVAETAAQIVELNDLTSSTVQAGQTLVVPVH